MRKFRPINATDICYIWNSIQQSERDDISSLEQRLTDAENLVEHLKSRLHEEKEHAVNGWDWVENTTCRENRGSRCVVFSEDWEEESEDDGQMVQRFRRDEKCAACGSPV